MASFDEFKTFIKDKPFLKDKVRNKETTWQELFERYDLYGKDDEIFKENVTEEKKVEKETTQENKTEETKDNKSEDSLSSFFNMLSGIDVDKISDGLNGMKKILSILSEVSGTDDNVSFSSRRNQRPYQRDDD